MNKIEKLKEKLTKSSNSFTFDEISNVIELLWVSFHNREKHQDQEYVLPSKGYDYFT